MKKRFFYLLLVVILALSTFCVTSCKEKDNNPYQLTYNVKYVHNNNINTHRTLKTNPTYLSDFVTTNETFGGLYYIYFTFYKGGTGEYHYFYCYHQTSTTTKVTHYTIHFTYEIVEDTLFYFQSGITIHEDDNQTSAPSSYAKSDILLVSKNFVMTTDSTVYINENYLSKIPNYKNKSLSSLNS